MKVPYHRSDKKRGRPFDNRRLEYEKEKAYNQSRSLNHDAKEFLKRQKLENAADLSIPTYKLLKQGEKKAA